MLLKNQSQSELNLSRGVSAGSRKQVRWLPEVCREVIEPSKLIDLYELGGAAQKTVVVRIHTLVITIQQVKRFCHEFEFHVVASINASGQAHVSAGIIRAKNPLRIRRRTDTREAVVDAGSGALKLINCAKSRDRSHQWVDAGGQMGR